jgi:molybdopterin-guanine dinucleotide biosynthesis protein A
MTPDQITGVILAGGRGSRMGGVDKGLQEFRGEPMVQHVLRRLSPQVGALMFNANQNIARYEAFGVPVWQDETTGFVGPLAGIETALRHCETPWLVTAPCDSPFLPEDLVARLAEAVERESRQLAVAVTGDSEPLQTQPVFALLNTSLLPSLTAYLQQGGRKIDPWQKAERAAQVRFADEDAFRNINTVEELRRFEST